MIDISAVLGWLNALGNSSHLNNELRRLIRESLRSGPSDGTMKLLLERLRNIAQSSTNPLERGEILLHCAAISYWRRWFLQSARYANGAVFSYENDDHRRAVALWMRGTVQWETHQNHDAYTSWEQARKIFQTCQDFFQNSPEQREWYGQKIWEMNIECTGRPEEILTWLNHFEASSLGWSSREVLKCVQEKIRQQAYPSIYALMQDFQEAKRKSQEIYEKAEVNLEFGLALYQLGYTRSAIELVRTAVQKFYSGLGSYHKQVVARCMLGAMEWMNNSSPKQAFLDWTRSIEEFEELRSWANRDNLQAKEHWYNEHRAVLRVALSEHLPHRYQDLVFLVDRDLDEANRLIELELRQFPQDDLTRLIERAIEHVLLG
jgi:tetratricopeptide (TPR) repeat protein